MMKRNNLKLWVGISMAVPWLYYHLSELARNVRDSRGDGIGPNWGLILSTCLMIVGLMVLQSTNRKDREDVSFK